MTYFVEIGDWNSTRLPESYTNKLAAIIAAQETLNPDAHIVEVEIEDGISIESNLKADFTDTYTIEDWELVCLAMDIDQGETYSYSKLSAAPFTTRLLVEKEICMRAGRSFSDRYNLGGDANSRAYALADAIHAIGLIHGYVEESFEYGDYICTEHIHW